MIISEITEIIENSKNLKILGNRLNDLYNEFRDGRDTKDILKLLKHSNDTLVWHGCSICCEIVVKNLNDKTTLIIELLHILKNNKNSNNRERAFDALYGFYMDTNDTESIKKISLQLKNDPNDEIRFIANNFLKDNFKL